MEDLKKYREKHIFDLLTNGWMFFLLFVGFAQFVSSIKFQR